MPPFLLRLETAAWVALLALFAWFAGWHASGVLGSLAGAHIPVTDFLLQWTFARFAWDGHAIDIYDAARLHPYQFGLVPVLRQTFPYPYPPSFLLYLLPLGGMGPGVAWAAWMAGTLALPSPPPGRRGAAGWRGRWCCWPPR